jgi:ribosomal protein S18 acetylase RimI-like enzyme
MIRLASTADVDRLAELDLELFQELSLNEGTFRRELEFDQCWVIGEPIVAYALVRTEHQMSDLLRLGVHPESQKQGLGTRLLRHVIDDVPGELMLTVKRTNEAAVRLYRRHGFHFSSILPEAYIMRKVARRTSTQG